ncbi:hypothetical protein ACWGRF_01975 [Streptomyces zhihengii]
MNPIPFLTPGVRSFAEDVDRERQRQLAKFGDQQHRDGTGGAHRIEAAIIARAACEDAAESGYGAWSFILDEEVREALAESDAGRLRAELVQVAAVCAAWVYDLDRRAAEAADQSEHYPTRLGIFCDTCRVELQGEFIVTDAMGKAQRLNVIRNHVASLGWRCDASGDYCPECKPAAPVEEPFVPRTERAYWQDIADALNAANRVGMPVGIDLDGTLTDHNSWSVVWDRTAERWDVAGYEDNDQGPAVEEQPAEPGPLDVFTEAATRRAALLSGADAIEALPQDFECDPDHGNAVKLLRRLAGLATSTEQPIGPTWQARASHAAQLYATTAIERDDARSALNAARARITELEKRAEWLGYLEAAGVDNWPGIDTAREIRDNDRHDAEEQAR